MHQFEVGGAPRHNRSGQRPASAAATACVFSLCLGAQGCGSDPAGKHEELGDPCASAGPIDPTSLIDDFEDQDANLPMVAGRSGSWWAADDETPNASFEPQDELVPELLPEPRCSSQLALRVSGSGFTNWGSMIGMHFAYAPNEDGIWGGVPHSAGDHRGIAFWAKVGDEASVGVAFGVHGRVLGEVPDPCPETEPNGDGCLMTFGVPLTGLTSQWQYYEVPFSGLATHPVTESQLDTSALYSLTFNFPPASVFDFWLDDVRFY